MTYDTGVTALRGIDLTIDQGEFAAIMGPSGCSKSTLLNLIAGLEHPTSGEIWIGAGSHSRRRYPPGNPCDDPSRTNCYEEHIGFRGPLRIKMNNISEYVEISLWSK
jgi:ABC-type lipoprotein export system ATPase subunit